MLLSITTTHPPATDLGYLLHKNPARSQSFELSFGRAHVFYPEATPDRCTACLLLDVDTVELTRSRRHQGGPLSQYVNDRPYVASSFLSNAISRVYGTAMSGRSKEKPELAATPIPLTATLAVLPCAGGDEGIRRLFEPLGYAVTAQGHPLDPAFPDWGESRHYTVMLERTCTVAELLTHLYVLVPVLDNFKHYYVGPAELEKLLSKGAGWLAKHPEKEFIARRYLCRSRSLARQALARLAEEEDRDEAGSDEADETTDGRSEVDVDTAASLDDQRRGAVLSALRGSGARTVLDLGCGEGQLLRDLLGSAGKQFERIVGMDVSIRSLEIAARRLRLDRMPALSRTEGPERQRQRIELIHGSLMYRDARLAGFDAAVVVEVVEHLDPPRLAAFERVLFEHARPATVVLTTPNREYNATWEPLVITPATSDAPAVTKLRHRDHRFEWTRAEFRAWTAAVADRHNYTVRHLPVGPEHPRPRPADPDGRLHP